MFRQFWKPSPVRATLCFQCSGPTAALRPYSILHLRPRTRVGADACMTGRPHLVTAAHRIHQHGGGQVCLAHRLGQLDAHLRVCLAPSTQFPVKHTRFLFRVAPGRDPLRSLSCVLYLFNTWSGVGWAPQVAGAVVDARVWHCVCAPRISQRTFFFPLAILPLISHRLFFRAWSDFMRLRIELNEFNAASLSVDVAPSSSAERRSPPCAPSRSGTPRTRSPCCGGGDV